MGANLIPEHEALALVPQVIEHWDRITAGRVAFPGASQGDIIATKKRISVAIQWAGVDKVNEEIGKFWYEPGKSGRPRSLRFYTGGTDIFPPSILGKLAADEEAQQKQAWADRAVSDKGDTSRASTQAPKLVLVCMSCHAPWGDGPRRIPCPECGEKAGQGMMGVEG